MKPTAGVTLTRKSAAEALVSEGIVQSARASHFDRDLCTAAYNPAFEGVMALYIYKRLFLNDLSQLPKS